MLALGAAEGGRCATEMLRGERARWIRHLGCPQQGIECVLRILKMWGCVFDVSGLERVPPCAGAGADRGSSSSVLAPLLRKARSTKHNTSRQPRTA
jgi:hypothetical protein